MARAGKLSKDQRREQQRQIQQKREEARRKLRQANRLKRVVFGLAAVSVAALAIFLAFRYALNGAAGVTAQSVSANLGAPTSDVPSTPADGFTRVGSPLYQNGKAELLFIGAQYCPHCAGQRWAVVKALDQFGTFSNLTSSANDDGSIPTFDVLNATYTSPYLAFVHRDLEDRDHKPLETLSPDEQSLFSQYDPNGSIPLVVVGGYDIIGDAYNISDIHGKTFHQVQNGLQHPASSVFAPEINAEANTITALICHADRMRPASACNRPAIRKIVATLR
jgi:hypothetical protein